MRRREDGKEKEGKQSYNDILFGICQVIVLIPVRQERGDVLFERLDNVRVRVKLLDGRIVAVFCLGEVVPGPAEEVVFPSVVVVLCVFVRHISLLLCINFNIRVVCFRCHAPPP
jgi:hypothetical protein